MNKEKFAKQVFLWSFIVLILGISTTIFVGFNSGNEGTSFPEGLQMSVGGMIAVATMVGIIGIIAAIFFLAKSKLPPGGTK